MGSMYFVSESTTLSHMGESYINRWRHGFEFMSYGQPVGVPLFRNSASLHKGIP